MTDDVGKKPLLQWVSINDLFIDDAYQRSISSKRSQRVINHIADDFLWPAFGALMLSNRGGKFAVVDGQHRLEGARRRGITNVPCVVVKFASIQEETRAFVTANKLRTSMTPMAIYHASLAADDPAAVRLANLLRKINITIPKYPQGETGPRETYSVSLLLKALQKHGEDIVGPALTAISETWPETDGQMRSSLIRALIEFYARYGGEADRDQLLDALERIEPQTLEINARLAARKNETTIANEMLEALIIEYNTKTAPGERLEAESPKRSEPKKTPDRPAPRPLTYTPKPLNGGLTATQESILRRVCARVDLGYEARVAEIQEIMQIEPAALKAALDELKAKDYIHKHGEKIEPIKRADGRNYAAPKKTNGVTKLEPMYVSGNRSVNLDGGA